MSCRFLGSIMDGFVLEDITLFILLILLIFLRSILKTLTSLSNQTNHRVEWSFDIDTCLCWRFDEIAIERASFYRSFFSGYLSVCYFVAFVSHKNEWHFGKVLDSKYLISKFVDSVICWARCNWVDNEKSFAISNPLITQCSVFLFSDN